MKREEMLTKLAMEHTPDEWRDVATWTYDEHQFGWNEYQLRRTDLINRPSWDDAPEWAQWLAQDKSGEWVWHEGKPEAECGEYTFAGDGNYAWAADGLCPAGHNWRDTLEQRPAFDEPRTESIAAKARAAGQAPHLVASRLRRGMPLDMALTLPPLTPSEIGRAGGRARAVHRGAAA